MASPDRKKKIERKNSLGLREYFQVLRILGMD